MEIVKPERSLLDEQKQLYRGRKHCEACRQRKQMDTQACPKSNAVERDWWSQRKKTETDGLTDIEQGEKRWEKALYILSMQTKEENNQDCSCRILIRMRMWNVKSDR